MRWSFYLLLLLVLVDGGYLASIWPDWQAYKQGPIQQSTFIRDYENEQRHNPDWPELRWNPVALKRIPRNMVRAVIVAEDSRFYTHDGVDWEALGDAMEYNLERGRMVYGGSTISQQTAKNLFLNSSRNPLRKWHELVLTLAMEHYLSKRRIMEYYLNVAQFGHGLPSPATTNPAARNKTFLNRVNKINRHFRKWASN